MATVLQLATYYCTCKYPVRGSSYQLASCYLYVPVTTVSLYWYQPCIYSTVGTSSCSYSLVANCSTPVLVKYCSTPEVLLQSTCTVQVQVGTSTLATYYCNCSTSKVFVPGVLQCANYHTWPGTSYQLSVGSNVPVWQLTTYCSYSTRFAQIAGRYWTVRSCTTLVRLVP